MGSAQSTPVPRPAVEASLSEKQRRVINDNNSVTLTDRVAALTIRRDAPAELTSDELNDWSRAYNAVPSRQAIGTILSKQDLLANLTSRKAAIADQQVFNLKLSTEITPITNQMSSGRCWLFASTNCARLAFAKRYNVEMFEFSQSYLFFYDSLEKANYFLENSIDLVEEPLDSRIVQYLSQLPENDGGQWDMVVNLITKYGLVPKSCYPESFHSSNSGKLNSLLTSKLREYSLELRQIYGNTRRVYESRSDALSGEWRTTAVAACRSRKAEQMNEIYGILALTLGEPPRAHDVLMYEFYDKDKKLQSFSKTPLDIYESLGSAFKASDCISLINDPRNDENKLYTVERLGNVWGARPVLYVNTSMQTMHDVIVKMLKADLPIWFGCDVGKCSSTALGIMDDNLFDYENTFGVGLNMSKAERLSTGESEMTHAMVLVAAHLDKDGKISRLRVENSWSDTAGSKGYFVCTWKWFCEYSYQIVVPRKLAPPELVKIFEHSKPVALPAWDPMGSLA